MRRIASSIALGTALVLGLSGLSAGSLAAQDQPAPGAPPPAATSEAPAASPQPGEAQPGPAPGPQRQARAMARRLALTPKQQSEVESILADRQQRVQRARADASLPPRARRARIRRILRKSDGKINALLTDAQRQQYAQMKHERREGRQMRRQQQAGAPPAASNE